MGEQLDAAELKELMDKDRIVGILPFDREVFKACLKGSSVPQIKEMKEIVDSLQA
jgi:CO dehydrogenase maturation factor